MTRWSLFLQTLSLLLHHFLGLYSHDPDIPLPMNVERVNNPNLILSVDVYLTHFFDGVQGLTLTSDLAGTLRLKRAGSTLTGFYFDGASFVAIDSGPGSAGPVNFSLALFTDRGTPGGQVAFDNFQVIADHIRCP